VTEDLLPPHSSPYQNSQRERERERERNIPIELFSLKEHFGLPIVFVLFAYVVVFFANVVHGFSFVGGKRETEKEREDLSSFFFFWSVGMEGFYRPPEILANFEVGDWI
jgi:hypothetical protein